MLARGIKGLSGLDEAFLQYMDWIQIPALFCRVDYDLISTSNANTFLLLFSLIPVGYL